MSQVQHGTFTDHCALRIIDAMPQDVDRIVVPMPRQLVERIDDFRFSRRLPSRAEAIRQLIEAGLKSFGQTKESKPKL